MSSLGNSPGNPPVPGAHAYDGLDRVLHEKARLGIAVALLNRPGGVLFPELRELCALTDGNLNRHLAMMQDRELVERWKSVDGGRPRTLVRLTRSGRSEVLAYLDELHRVLRDARAAEEQPTLSRSTMARGAAGTGWSSA